MPAALQDTCPNRAGDKLENSQDPPPLKVMQQKSCSSSKTEGNASTSCEPHHCG